MSKTIAIIGCGNMGEAFAQILAKEHSVILCDRNHKWAEELVKKIGAVAKHQAKDALSKADIVILAIKPQDLSPLCEAIGKKLTKGQILVSMLTGISLETLRKKFKNPTIVRIAPNLAVRHGKGVIGIAQDSNLPSEKKAMIEKLFSSMGQTYWLPEEKLNALTILVGSGPAFALILIESMVDAAIAMGFSAPMALELVMHMWEGTLTELEKSQKHPGEIKWEIASPAGTTIAGIQQMEESAVRSGIIKTFLAALHRAEEFSKEQ